MSSKEYFAEYRRKNRDLIRERDRLRRQNNGEREREYDRLYYWKNHERIRQGQKKYYDKNREKISYNVNLWRKNNPYKTKQYRQKYMHSELGKQNRKRSNQRWAHCKLNYARSEHGKHIRRTYQQSVSGLEVIKRNGVEYRDKLRVDLFNILGWRCVECGYDVDYRALQFDHIDDDGATERKRFNGGRRELVYYREHPEEAKKKLQTVCANCNWIKRHLKKQTPVV